jgi:hypothetical protein
MPSLYDKAAPARRRSFAALTLAALTTVFSSYGHAQVTKGSGSDNADSRASDSTQRANPSGNTVQESAPQSKDAAQPPQQAKARKNRDTNGAGGFENGLYGTGAGNNK